MRYGIDRTLTFLNMVGTVRRRPAGIRSLARPRYNPSMSTVVEKRPTKTPTKPPRICHTWLYHRDGEKQYLRRVCDGELTPYKPSHGHTPAQCKERGHMVCVVCTDLKDKQPRI